MPAAANTRGPSCLSATETLSFAWRLAWHGRRCASSRVTSSPRGPWTTRGGGSAAYSAECAPPAAESLCQRTFRGFRPLVLRPNSNRPTRGLRDNRCPCTTCSQNTPASPWLTPQPPAATPLRHAPRRVALGDRGVGSSPEARVSSHPAVCGRASSRHVEGAQPQAMAVGADFGIRDSLEELLQLVAEAIKVSTRILGRRTAPYPPFLIPYRVPRGFTPRS